MIKTMLIFPDGTEIYSGADKLNAIQNTSFDESINDAEDLTLGSVCAKMLSVKIITPNNEFSCEANNEIIVFQEDENGARYKKGHFIAEKPTKAGANTTQITAYDKVIMLDKDLTSWLQSLNDYPYTMFEFAKMICLECGVELANTSILNGDTLIYKFEANGITGRQLMGLIGQAAGSYCTANIDGKIEFSWYKNNDVPITPTRIGNSVPYFSGGLSYADYNTAKIDRVQIRQSAEDIGTIYPTNGESGNPYIIEANPLLTALDASTLLFVAQNLYLRLKEVQYTPCTVSVPANFIYNVGDIINITDRNGKNIVAYVMSKKRSGQKETLECTGNYKRNGTAALYNTSYKAISGKNFSLQASIDGLKVKNEDLAGKVSKLSLTVDDISTEVSDAQKNITTLQQTAGTVSVKAESEQGTLTTIISNDGTWKTEYVDANGRKLSGISFDFLLGAFVFNGTGSFTGELNIGGGNFVVDVNGNVTAQGDTKIYGGKYYAMDDDGNGNYTTMNEDGFSVYSSDSVQRVKVGFPPNHPESPYVVLNGGTIDSASRIIMKQFTDGMWIGNDAPINNYGEFRAGAGYNGIFVSLADSQTYVVAGTNMQSVYTGEAIAKFG